jgi:hypothetical protein
MSKKQKSLVTLSILSVLIIYLLVTSRTNQITSPSSIKSTVGSEENITKKINAPKSNIKKVSLDNNLSVIQKAWEDNDTYTPVIEYLDDLVESAKQGNADAQYHLSMVQRKCNGVPETEESLESALTVLDDFKHQYEIDLFVFCKGYPRNGLSEKGWKEMIVKAARGGNIQAKLEFPAAALALLPPEELIARSSEITDLKREAMNYLIDAKNSGELNALMVLGNAYFDGYLTEKNMEEAYAYYYAFSQLSQSSSIDSLMDTVGRNLNYDQIEKATKRGSKYVKCCK